jgi:hypothetical protein
MANSLEADAEIPFLITNRNDDGKVREKCRHNSNVKNVKKGKGTGEDVPEQISRWGRKQSARLKNTLSGRLESKQTHNRGIHEQPKESLKEREVNLTREQQDRQQVQIHKKEG